MTAVIVTGQSTGDTSPRLETPLLETLRLPYMPDEVEVSGLADAWQEQPRPGAVPLNNRKGRALAKTRVTFTVGDGEPITAFLAALQAHAASDHPTRLFFASVSRGPARVTDMSWVEDGDFYTEAGEPGRAEVTLQLTAASDASIPIGPLPKGKPPKEKKSPKKKKK